MLRRPSSFFPSLRTAFLVLLYAAFIVLAIPILLLCVITGLRDPLIVYGKWAMRVSRRVLGIRVEVEGLEHVDRRATYVFMPNHLSFIDGPLLEMLLPAAARIIIKKGVAGIPVAGLAMLHVGFITVDRKGAQGGKKSIEKATRYMRERGYSFLVFPEGTRSRDANLGPFRRGGFFLALASGVPILPITITGTFELMPKGQWYARSGPVKVVFHEPVPVAGYTVETMGELIARVRAEIAKGLAEPLHEA